MAFTWLEKLLCFIPMVFRLMAFFYFDPLLGGTKVPQQVKVGLAFLMAVVMVPQAHAGLSLDTDAWTLGAIIAGEIAIGLIMGFMVKLVFMGIEMAGQLVGMQMGFGIVNVLDQTQDAQVSLIGQFYEFMALMLFLSVNAHHILIRGLAKSFEVVPVMGFHGFKNGFPEYVIMHSGKILVLVMVIAAPGIVAMFLLNCALGITARTFPQMNIFVIGFPVSIFVGLTVILTSFPYCTDIFMKGFSMGWLAIEKVLTYMS